MRGLGAKPLPSSTAVPASSEALGRSVDDVLRWARRQLSGTSFGASTREAALLLGHLLGVGEVELLTRGGCHVAPETRRAYEALVERRLRGEPVAYLTGQREFYGRWFAVDRRALIPRPETEHLVELALELDLPATPGILDVGTGTGCIALTLALERGDARVTGTDLSRAALGLAAENRRQLGVEDRVRLVGADLTDALRVEAFDLVVSNPPYIDPGDAHALSPEITRFEPDCALYSEGPGGSSVSRRLLSGLSSVRPGVRVLLEIGAGQLDAVSELADARGFSTSRVVQDYAGIPRVVLLERRAS